MSAGKGKEVGETVEPEFKYLGDALRETEPETTAYVNVGLPLPFYENNKIVYKINPPGGAFFTIVENIAQARDYSIGTRMMFCYYKNSLIPHQENLYILATKTGQKSWVYAKYDFDDSDSKWEPKTFTKAFWEMDGLIEKLLLSDTKNFLSGLGTKKIQMNLPWQTKTKTLKTDVR